MTPQIALGFFLAVQMACSVAAPDEAALGKDQGYPVGSVRNWTQASHRIGSWSAPQLIEGLPHRVIDKSPRAVALAMATPGPSVRYTYQGREYSLDQYLDRQRVTGLMILKDGKVVLEKYQYGRGPESRFFSHSMAKSLTSLLVGIALDKGLIGSLDDLAQKYSPTLQGTAYGATRIRDLLRMASGVDFKEDYSGRDDLSLLSRSAFTDSPPLTDLFKKFNQKTPAGSRFNYASLETLALGYLLKDVTGQSITALTRDWVWHRMGAEDEAYWMLSKSGMEGVYCCFAASPRDWAKLGLIYAQNGSINGVSIVPEAFIREATATEALPHILKAGATDSFGGYGYQMWLLPGTGRQSFMKGLHGQALYVHAQAGLVMLHTAAFDKPSARMDPDPYDEQLRLWQGVVRTLAP